MEALNQFLRETTESPVAAERLDWNVVMRYLLNLHELKLSPHDVETAQFLTQILQMQEEQRKQLGELLVNVPLPNSKVVVTPVASDGILRRPTVTLSCSTVLELLKQARGCIDFRGWPVARRVGQNRGLYQANKGLYLRVEYPSTLDFQK